jgi:DNA-directed RNA polymerase specialized sigma24 family protein
MKMFRAIRRETRKCGIYATRDDFCRLFTEGMANLYLLSFLLTGDHEKAELCFIASIDTCIEGNSVFLAWAPSWSRRAIIQNSIQLVSPRAGLASPKPVNFDPEFSSKFRTMEDRDASFACILALDSFERFVFVMSVLERLPDADCSVLLSCSRNEIRHARLRALQLIGDRMIASRPVDGTY